MPAPRGKKPPTPKPPAGGGQYTTMPIRGSKPPVKKKASTRPAYIKK